MSYVFVFERCTIFMHIDAEIVDNNELGICTYIVYHCHFYYNIIGR